MKSLLLLGLRLYRAAISPFLPPSCRFIPSCSAYAEEAVERHGVVRGLALAAARVWRCRPGGGHGCDPVPLRASGGKIGGI